MAQSLRLSLIVEGIENVKQLNYFRQQGCEVMQGFLFSRPVAPARVAADNKAYTKVPEQPDCMDSYTHPGRNQQPAAGDYRSLPGYCRHHQN